MDTTQKRQNLNLYRRMQGSMGNMAITESCKDRSNTRLRIGVITGICSITLMTRNSDKNKPDYCRYMQTATVLASEGKE